MSDLFAIFLVLTIRTDGLYDPPRWEVQQCENFSGPFQMPDPGERDLYGKRGDAWYCPPDAKLTLPLGREPAHAFDELLARAVEHPST